MMQKNFSQITANVVKAVKTFIYQTAMSGPGHVCLETAKLAGKAKLNAIHKRLALAIVHPG